MLPWFKNVKPHKDIQSGHLDESVFAANLSEVASGQGREVYTNSEIFFSKTYFTLGLRSISKRVIQGLNGGVDSENRIVSLQTGFGGGKTHTLISLYHIAKLGNKKTSDKNLKELFDFTGLPKFDTANVAVFTNNTNDPVQGREIDGLTIRTLWGEIAYQLGGKEAYEIVRANDEKLIAPKGLFIKVLELCKPSLILIDELADYCISASAVKVEKSNLSDQTISFLQELTEAISRVDQCVLIATLPASAQEIAASEFSEQVLNALQNRIIRLGANLKPVEDEEIFEVVRRRLFEEIGDSKTIQEIADTYSNQYHYLVTEVPSHAQTIDYKEKIKKSYPFHPELIDMFRLRWASHPHFQRTRGVLRLLASIVADLWKRQGSLTGSNSLIHTSDVNFANVESLTSQINLLYGASWASVISADVSGSSSNAFRVDNAIKAFGDYNLTQGIASTIMLATFGSQGSNKGLTISELKLCMVKPDSFNPNDINAALDRMEDSAHYLYYSSSGQKRYWFHTKPNINILINQAKSDVSNSDIEAEILERLVANTRSLSVFNALVNPTEEIPEQTKPTLVVLAPKHIVNGDISKKTKELIEKIATKKGNSERVFRNTILFLVCTEIGASKLTSTIKDLVACQKISRDYQSQLEKEQKDELKRRLDEVSKQVDVAIATAYSVVIKYSAKDGCTTLNIKQFAETLNKQINQYVIAALKEDEWLLEGVGLETIKKAGLYPTIEKPVRAKDVYEAFIRFDDKQMIVNSDAVKSSIQRYCSNGEFAVATGEVGTFSKVFLKESIPYFDVNDSTYWLVDRSLKIETESLASAEVSYGVMSSANNNSNEMTVPGELRSIDAIKISGRIPTENFTQLFTSFIAPFAHLGNRIEVDVAFKIKSSQSSPLDESTTQYKNAKESAKQLGLKFEED